MNSIKILISDVGTLDNTKNNKVNLKEIQSIDIRK